MTIRTTLESLVNTSVLNIEQSNSRLQMLQEQIATGKKVNRPSDSPSDVGKILNLRAEDIRLDTYSSNIESGKQLLDFNASILESMASQIQRVQELTIQAVSATMDQNGRNSIANEINGILESVMLQEANTSLRGRYIFSGTETDTRPFVETRNSNGEISAVTYNGNGEKIEYQVGPGTKVQVNQPGKEIFIDSKLFDTIINIRDDLRSGEISSARGGLDNISIAYDSVLDSISKAGGISSTLEITGNRIEDTKLMVAEILASAESADLTELVLHLKEQENILQATLASTALIFRISILDYM